MHDDRRTTFRQLYRLKGQMKLSKKNRNIYLNKIFLGDKKLEYLKRNLTKKRAERILESLCQKDRTKMLACSQ